MENARKKFSLTMPVEVLDRLAAVAKKQSKEKLRKVSVASLVIDAVVRAYCRNEKSEEDNACGKPKCQL